ncbi:MAG: hypothetical protein ACRCYO_17995, partial [Bacteroidia bacterium]
LFIALLLLGIDRMFLSKQKIIFSSVYKNQLIAFTIAVVFLYEPIRRLIQHNTLDFGGKGGFYENTVMSVVETSFHNVHFNSGVLLFMQVIFTFLVVGVLALTIQKIRQRDRAFLENYTGLVVSNLLLLSLAFMVVIQHLLLGADYLVARFSVFLYPLFIIHLGYLFHYLLSLGFKKTSVGFLFFLATLAVFSFIKKVDLCAYSEWSFDQETKNMLQKLESFKPQSGKLKLGVHWFFEPTVNFYKKINHLTWLDTVDREKPNLKDDFYYVFETDSIPCKSDEVGLIFKFEKTQTILLRKKTSN